MILWCLRVCSSHEAVFLSSTSSKPRVRVDSSYRDTSSVVSKLRHSRDILLLPGTSKYIILPLLQVGVRLRRTSSDAVNGVAGVGNATPCHNAMPSCWIRQAQHTHVSNPDTLKREKIHSKKMKEKEKTGKKGK